MSCSGCYAQALHPPSDNEMSEAEIRRMMSEARELGVSFFVIAGGEPFLRPEILEIMKDFPEILFLVFTNGLLIDE
ncbi:radical SAM protein, partial [Candidatus Aerophobetes bacterium]|nr:radical SAM protein [Candidatus Aerophobetes bacterium]